MKSQRKDWRVTLILDLNRGLEAEEFGRIQAETRTRAFVQRGTNDSESAPVLTVTTLANAVESTDAVTWALRAVEQRLAVLPGQPRVLGIRNYLAAA